MLFIAYAAPSDPFHHPALFYLVIAIFGVVIVSAIVISLMMLVLRNVNREWPIRSFPEPATRPRRSRTALASSLRRHHSRRRHPV
jgi:hypothetical protein